MFKFNNKSVEINNFQSKDKKIFGDFAAGQKKIFLQISKGIIYFLVFLPPLFFLPWTSNILDFNKQVLFVFLIFIALICLLVNFLIRNQLEINFSFLNVPVLILILFLGISTVFSLSRYGSFWGWPLVVSSSFLSFLAFAFFYFLIIHLFKKEEIVFIFFTLFLSGFLLSLYFILQFFGRFILPIDFTRNIFFNSIGTINSLGIYFAILLLLLLPLFSSAKKFFKFILGTIGLLFLFCLLLINTKIVWLTFLVGLVFLFAFGVINLNKNISIAFLALIMFFLVLSSLMIFFRFSLPKVPQVPQEYLVGQIDNLKVFRNLPLKSALFGTGPGTFSFDWSKYRPKETNQKNFWNLRFSQGGSEILDRLVTTGIFGLLAFIFLISVFLKKNFGFLLTKENLPSPETQENLSLFLGRAILAGFFGLIFALFVYPFNFSLFFVFWLIISCLALLEKEKKKIFDLKTSKTGALAFSFLFVLILVLGMGIFILYSQKYFAEIKYYQGLRAFQKGNLQESLDFIGQAVAANPQMDLYKRDYSKVCLFRLDQVLVDSNLSQEEKQKMAQSLIFLAINTINETTNMEPFNVANWIIRGFTYQKVIGILGKAEDWAITSYTEAAELDPLSPEIFSEIGRVYLAKADMLAQQGKTKESQENQELAKNYFQKAIEVKSDYAVARYMLAMVDIKEGKIQEAAGKLEETQQLVPLDAGVAFQLGVLYYNNNQIDQAQTQFERAVWIDPNYANARYFLGLIYDRKGNKKLAIEQFEIIEKFNPDNQEVKKILDNLRNNKQALEGIIPGQPPIEEKPTQELNK